MQPMRYTASFNVGLLGSEKQKQELVPQLADLSLVGAWALTEPSNGSDASALKSTARKVSHDISYRSDLSFAEYSRHTTHEVKL